jgi:hypothetical protein
VNCWAFKSPSAPEKDSVRKMPRVLGILFLEETWFTDRFTE